MTLARSLATTRKRSRITARQPLVTVGCAGVNVLNRDAVPGDQAADVLIRPTFQNNTTESHTIRYNIEIGSLTFGPFRVDVPAGEEPEPEDEDVRTTREERLKRRLEEEDEAEPEPSPEAECESPSDCESWQACIDGVCVDVGGFGLAPAAPITSQQMTDRQQVTIQPGALSAGTHEVVVQQRFGRQQRASCGSIQVEEGAPEISRPFVEMSCDRPASTTTTRGEPTTVTTAVRLRNKDPRDSHAIRYEIVVGGVVVGTRRVTVNAEDTVVDESTNAVAGLVVGTPSQQPVVIRQLFGVQQEFQCGTLTVEPPPVPEPEIPTRDEEEPEEEEEEPGLALDQQEIPPAAVLGAVILVLVLAFAS